MAGSRNWGLMCVLVLFAACDYDSNYDALASFPSNASSKTIAELDLITPDVTDEKRVQSTEIESPQLEDKTPEFIAVQEGVRAYPFQSASSSGSNRFTQLDSLHTGLEAVGNVDFDGEHLNKLNSPFTATGLACADFNGDRLSDVLVVNQQHGVRFYRNLGNCQFEDVTRLLQPKIESMWGTSVTIVDINSDGLLDFYLCGYDCPNRLYVNQGRKFIEQASQYGLDFRGASVSAAFADYDRDGDVDMYLVTNRLEPDAPLSKLPVEREPGKPPRIKEEYRELNHFIPYVDGSYLPVQSGQYDFLFRNDDSKFVDVTKNCFEQRQPYRGMSAVWCDFNNDGWPDIYVANDQKDVDQYFRNNGLSDSGQVSFTDQSLEAVKQMSWYASGTELLDWNQDGFFDLVVGGNSKSNPAERNSSQSSLFGVKNDLWYLNSKPSQTLGNCFLVNRNGTIFGNLAASLDVAHTDQTWTVRRLDFDNDGFVDLFFGNGSMRDYLSNDRKRDLESLIADRKVESKGEFWQDKSRVRNENRLFKRTRNSGFRDITLDVGLGGKDLTQSTVVCDLDNDGDIDFLTVGNGEPIRLFRNDVSVGSSITIKLKGKKGNSLAYGAVCKLERDGQFRFATATSNRGFLSSEEPIFHFGLADSKDVQSLEIKWPSGVAQTIQQLAANLYYEIEEPRGGSSVGRGIKLDLNKKRFNRESLTSAQLKIEELEFDDFDVQPLIPFQHSTMGPGMAWGDIDGDTDYDLFLAGSAFEPGRLLENKNGEMKLIEQEAFRKDAKREDLGCLFFDADGDGDQDLYVVSGGVEDSGADAYQDRLYLNNGDGNFERSEDAVSGSDTFSGMAIAAADFDQDNDLDLFVGGRILPGRYPTTPKSLLLVNDRGRFSDETDKLAPDLKSCGMVTSSVWSDVDRDGYIDLVVTTEWGFVKVFGNEFGKLRAVNETGLEKYSGLFQSLCPGDVDNDGDIDFFVGNYGTNASYKVSLDQPVTMRYGPFGYDDSSRILESISVNGDEYFLRSKDALSKWGFALTKETSSTEFSKTTIQDYGLENVDKVSSFVINELRSAILVNESNENGIRFRFQPLPLIAQSSPVRGCQLCDVNGDGFLDLYLLQNEGDLHPVMEQCNFGSSLLLMGKGDGQFELPSDETGLEVHGFGKSLTVVDLNEDARADWVVAEKDSQLSLFTNQSGHLPLAIDVKKISGNRQIVGTKVLLDFENGTQQMHEIYLGGGYISQSPPIIYSGLDTKSPIRQITITWPDGSTKSGTVKSLFNK